MLNHSLGRLHALSEIHTHTSNMYVYKYTRIYTYIYTYIYVYIHTYIYTYIYIFTNIYMCVCVCEYIITFFKQATLLRRSTVLSLSLLLVFPASKYLGYHCAQCCYAIYLLFCQMF
jgi:hypothetical protein